MIDALPADALRTRFDPSDLGFETTDDLPADTEVVGQNRAVEALDFGMSIDAEGYNVFALGPPGTGRRPLVQHLLEEQAAGEATPPDLCYINHFDDEREPRALRLPAGRGRELKEDVDALIEELQTALPGTFESEEYRSRREMIQEEVQEGQEAALDDLQARAREDAYADLIATTVDDNDLRPFDRSGVARVFEHSLRVVGDTEKLSARVEDIRDLLTEADHWAQDGGADTVTGDHVQRAIDAQTRRAGRLRDRVQETIERENIYIDTTGATVGQINGLSYLEAGGFSFGRPHRITTRVRLGEGEIVDIEREAALGGPLHSKGVLILSGFLEGRFAQRYPLSLSARLVFEQSYGGIDGDSASSAELYALLSALAEVPLKQNLAVTGSVNQRGVVQPIGGVNEKVEGFFDVCEARGLAGDQGVLIPAANTDNLMLRPDVVAAVKAGRFHVYPVETVDQGIALLTGMEAGTRDEQGDFPDGTINARVEARLRTFADHRRRFARTDGTPQSSTEDA